MQYNRRVSVYEINVRQSLIYSQYQGFFAIHGYQSFGILIIVQRDIQRSTIVLVYCTMIIVAALQHEDV